jgi:REP element-mobilizing transposase RayT
LGSIIGQFKSIVTKQINKTRNDPGMPVWQRNYYEHIIRNETEMNRIRQYIINNPSQWDNDENNPANYMKTDF